MKGYQHIQYILKNRFEMTVIPLYCAWKSELHQCHLEVHAHLIGYFASAAGALNMQTVVAFCTNGLYKCCCHVNNMDIWKNVCFPAITVVVPTGTCMLKGRSSLNS